MVVPAYCRSREGHMYRVTRSSELLGTDRIRYLLRAIPIKQDGTDGYEVALEFDASVIRERIALKQTMPTPEETFERLWQQLRIDLDVQYE